jgi:hypothetical protein
MLFLSRGTFICGGILWGEESKLDKEWVNDDATLRLETIRYSTKICVESCTKP